MNSNLAVISQSLAEHQYVILGAEEVLSIGALLGRPSKPQLLMPTSRESARGRSLSGLFGLGAFPWHTDGAIANNPPRWIILRTMTGDSGVGTELLRPSGDILGRLRRTILTARDPHGSARYFPAFMPTTKGYTKLRWDPTKCAPMETEVVSIIENAEPSMSVNWVEGRALIVDNAALLHRRPAVATARRVLERTYVWSE